MARWRTRRAVVENATWQALATGLSAAGWLYAGRVRARLAQGYTTGDFVTGHVAGSVEVVPPVRTAEGLRLTVGSNVPYALYWEVGHVNIFAHGLAPASSLLGKRVTGTYQRVEIWRPYLLEMRELLRATVQAVAARQVEAMVGGTDSGLDVVTGETREQKRGRVGRLVDGP